MSLSKEHVLVTGGAGYVGSHTVLQLLKAGAKVTIVDNFCNSSPKVVRRLTELAGEELAGGLAVVEADLLDKAGLEEKLFAPAAAEESMFTSCIHFAGLKAVGESVAKPVLYYHNNITSTLFLLELLEKYGCRKIVFSSSATVYGSAPSPLSEDGSVTGRGVTNPYGQTKYMIECILSDFARANPLFGVVVLRCVLRTLSRCYCSFHSWVIPML
jgi:UDP-glucose 4-epimerase